jgi:hypothetical protein
MRWHRSELAAIDEWRRHHDQLSRTEAIRRLVELGLRGGSGPAPGIALVPLADHPRARSGRRASEASDMAAKQIDKLADPLVPEEERRARKRRLIKGPREFREMRGDQPRPKAK